MKKLFPGLILIPIIYLFVSCSKDDDKDDKKSDGTLSAFEMKMTDSRTAQTKAGTISYSSLADDIIDPLKLTKYELELSNIELKDSAGNFMQILESPVLVDLRQFRGTAKDLLSVDLKTGKYKAVKISISGVDVTYDNNNYQANSSGASVTIGSINYTVSSGLPNPFVTEQSVEIPFEFEIIDTIDLQGVRLFFDAEASAKEISVDAPVIGTILFAGIRENLFLSAILEDNIQQISHSAPTDITFTTTDDISYYGTHTFVDFAEIGGTINSHTSQHVFRGADGTLLVDAEDMAINTNTLSQTTISASGETDVRADETFKYLTIKNTLATKGYDLVSGNVYYFSLRKTWNITTGGNTYELTRINEPIPVFCP